MVPTICSHTNVEMPAIMYGTAWKENKTADLVFRAIEQGFRGIDTACQPKHYNEEGVGEGIARAIENGIKRDDLFVQTKFTGIQGQDPQRVPYDPDASVRDQVKQSLSVSQRNLKMVDALVLHGPLKTWDMTIEAWKTMEELYELGDVRQIGISNVYDPELLKALIDVAKYRPATLQNRFYNKTEYDIKIRQICKEHNIVYQCFWTLTANPHILNSSTLQEISKAKAKTPEQIFFRFIHQLDIQILTGTTNTEHMKQDLGIFEFELDLGEFESIKALGPF